MRKIFLLIALLCAGLLSFAQEGVNFEHLSFNEALQKAKTENKLIFVDCYTSWCGPCRNMAEHIFPQKKVGDYFNSKFICVKYDMEKGEGPELSKRFGVRAYPTFLVLRADGTLVHKFVGGRDVDGIIQSTEEAFDSSTASEALRESYNAGNRDKSFLLKYLKVLMNFYDPQVNVVAEELMDQLSSTEKVAEEYWFVYTNPKLSPADSKIEKYLLQNYDRFCKFVGVERVSKEVERRYAEKLMKVFKREATMTEPELKGLGQEIASLKLPKDAELQAYVEIALGMNKSHADLISVCEKEFLKIQTLEIPYVQFYDRIIKEGTLEDQKRWIALGEKVYELSKDEDMKKVIKFCLDYYKNNNKQN